MLRSSASLLVVAPSNRLLFMRRPASGSYPNSHVFPGGATEEADYSLPYTALRETFEETGLFIAPCSSPIVHPIGKHATYDEALESVGVKSGSLDWSHPSKLAMRHISQWVTPKTYKKRFSTHFYVYQVPRAYNLDGVKSPEAELLEWLTPEETLDKFESGLITLMPPQFYMVTAIHKYGLDGAIDRLSGRVFEPYELSISEDRKVQELDWGKGEKGIIYRDDRGLVKDIKHICNSEQWSGNSTSSDTTTATKARGKL